MKKSKIVTFKPVSFKSIFIDNHFDKQIFKDGYDQFFIHSLKEDKVHLRLPLPIHRKTVNDFMLITNGSCVRQVGITKIELLDAELLFVAKSSASSTEYMSDDIEGYYCHFNDELLKHDSSFLDLLNLPESNRRVTLDSDALIRITAILDNLTNIYKSSQFNETILGLIGSYLTVLFNEVLWQIKKQGNAPQNKSNRLTMSYIEMVKANYMKDWNVSDYADRLMVTANHLNKAVKNMTQRSASEILAELRVQEAKIMLLQTDNRISEIASILGFKDISYFGKFFKKQTGLSPVNYRKMIGLYQ